MVSELIDYYGLNVVQAYMSHIQNNAEVAVRDLLRTVGLKTAQRTGDHVLSAVDYLDDGSPIMLKVTIDVKNGSSVFDFRLVFIDISSLFILILNDWEI